MVKINTSDENPQFIDIAPLFFDCKNSDPALSGEPSAELDEFSIAESCRLSDGF